MLNYLYFERNVGVFKGTVFPSMSLPSLELVFTINEREVTHFSENPNVFNLLSKDGIPLGLVIKIIYVPVCRMKLRLVKKQHLKHPKKI